MYSVCGNMDCEKLIEYVRGYSELYDISHSKYSDSLHREKIWVEIARKLSQTAIACKKTWINLRDSYRRSLKRQKELSNGPSSKKARIWKYSDQMSFIKAHFHERTTTTGIDDSLEDDNNDNSKEYIRRQADQEQSVNPAPEEANESQDKIASKKTTKHLKPTEELISSDFLSSSQKSANWTKTQGTASAVLMRYILEEKKQRAARSNAVDSFLEGIAVTLSSFSPYRLNIAKQRIFAIVSELEMEQIMSTETTSKDKSVREAVPSPSTNSDSVGSEETLGDYLLNVDDNEEI